MKKILIIIGVLLSQVTVHAQQLLDSLQVQAGTNVTVASKGFLPLWLVSNRFGVISDQQFDFSTHIRATNSNLLLGSATDNKGLYVDYGIDAYNNDHLRNTFFNEAYVKLRFQHLTLSGGRFKQIIGEVDPELSSGSLGLSGNAIPIPKINLALSYTNIPFTNGWLQFKGMISHGWMGNDQFMKDAFLHEKNLYVRIGKHKFKIYGGLEHYAVWGGHKDGFYTTDRSFSQFIDVVTGIAVNDGSVNGDILPNRPGDQRGVIEAGAEWEDDNFKLQVNNQTPFDSGEAVDIKNIDRLLSFNFTNKKEGSILKKIVVEYIHTNQGNDFIPNRYRQSLYNNGIYRTGWEYRNRIIGTPIFTNRTRASQFIDGVQTYNWNAPAGTIARDNILINRVLGWHLGTTLALTPDLSSKTMLTYTKNENVARLGFASDSATQWYTMEQVNYQVPNTQLSLTAAIAYDFGKLYNNFGSSVGLQWQLRK
jgi:hypothetical protein